MKNQKLYTRIKLVLFLFTLSCILFILVGNHQDKALTKKDAFLEEELAELASYFDQRERLDTSISKVDVAWHLDHTLKVINRIHDTLTVSNPADYAFNLNFLRTVVFSSGKMPRGRGQAPKSVLPPEEILTADLHTQLQEAQEHVKEWNDLPKQAFFKHPVFGKLHRKHAQKFIVIHTQHHLAIIRDILKEEE